MRNYSQVFALFLLSTLVINTNCHRLRHLVPVDKEKEEKAKEHPPLLRLPYSISKELWFPFGSFGYKRHVEKKRDIEEVKEIEFKAADLDGLTRLPIPGIESLNVDLPPGPAPGPVLAEPLPPDTPVIRPLNAPPVPVLPEKIEPVFPEKIKESEHGLNTDIKPFINPGPVPQLVRPIEENLIVPSPLPPPPPPVEAGPPKETSPEGFGTYMKKGRELILDFGRFIFTRMSDLLNRARTFRFVSSRTVAN